MLILDKFNFQKMKELIYLLLTSFGCIIVGTVVFCAGLWYAGVEWNFVVAFFHFITSISLILTSYSDARYIRLGRVR